MLAFRHYNFGSSRRTVTSELTGTVPFLLGMQEWKPPHVNVEVIVQNNGLSILPILVFFRNEERSFRISF